MSFTIHQIERGSPVGKDPLHDNSTTLQIHLGLALLVTDPSHANSTTLQIHIFANHQPYIVVTFEKFTARPTS